jgi:hypothetical protein
MRETFGDPCGGLGDSLQRAKRQPNNPGGEAADEQQAGQGDGADDNDELFDGAVQRGEREADQVHGAGRSDLGLHPVIAEAAPELDGHRRRGVGRAGQFLQLRDRERADGAGLIGITAGDGVVVGHDGEGSRLLGRAGENAFG